MAATLRPLQDRLLVKPLDEGQRTPGGIIIPDTAKEKPVRGRVLAAGAGGRTEAGRQLPMGIRVGDVVLYAKWSGTEIRIGGEDLLVLKEADVFGVLE
jgi:chaperonin GroES